MSYDLVIKGGEIVTATDRYTADIGIRDGRIAALAEDLHGADVIDAAGRLVLPGGIETHCHIAQESGMGIMAADDYRTGSIAAAFGGNASFIPFAAQQRGWTITQTLEIYDQRAASSVLDYGYHLIVTDPTERALAEELPAAFARGVTSFKVFMTYPNSMIDDGQFLDILTMARAHGALTMVHAENDAMIKWAQGRFLGAGHTEPRFHAPSRPRLAEEEAIHRAIALAKLADAPLFIVHVSTMGGAEEVIRAKRQGAKIFAETCVHYLTLSADDLDRPGKEGAKYICSPPMRDAATQETLWAHTQQGLFSTVTSDHAPFRFDETGKFAAGADVPFNRIANGMPGLEMRLPMLFTEGVVNGRISLNQFVALTATTPARVFGVPNKGSVAIGMDADLAIWDPAAKWVAGETHDNVNYNPFEGRRMVGRPVTVLNRGARVVDDGALLAKPGDGRFIARNPVDLTGMPGHKAPELDPSRNFGAEVAP